ncbi:hypothetical protein SISNIDRAFT_267345 [Sistotremastrum niveocremeum HHB9708]|uniref:F-box domain-containing protein n=1 Tax=Sistotremastrum niveocremeum HHB9708 TaxID=1314777 RepID=A0A164P3D9_9AGAM|nr:hypothetical protein SISNIDRAFT_267345 [Sistotremastrum niveocremeum HHB9708]
MSRRKSTRDRRSPTTLTKQSNGVALSLPVELWRMIFEMAGHPLARDWDDDFELGTTFGVDTYKNHCASVGCRPPLWLESHRTLSAISLTCHTWSAISTPLLYSLLWIATPDHARKLLPVLRRTPVNGGFRGATFGEHVTALIVNQHAISGAVLKSLCDLCPRLRAISAHSVGVKTVTQWRALERSLSQLSSLRHFDICCGTVDQNEFPTTRKPSTFPNLHYFAVSFNPWCGFGPWQMPNLRHLSFVIMADDQEHLRTQLIPFLRSNGSQIRNLELLTNSNFDGIESFMPFGADAIIPLCPNLRELSGSIHDTSPTPFSRGSGDNETRSTIFKPLSDPKKTDIKISLPSWWKDVIATWQTDRIFVGQLPEGRRLTYKALIEFAEFVDI